MKDDSFRHFRHKIIKKNDKFKPFLENDKDVTHICQ